MGITRRGLLAGTAAVATLPRTGRAQGKPVIRPDGRVVSDVHVFEVKKPAESKSEWDLYIHRATLPPERAWRPMSEGGCPLVHA